MKQGMGIVPLYFSTSLYFCKFNTKNNKYGGHTNFRGGRIMELEAV